MVYASDGANSKQYLWDGISLTPSSEISWYDKPIQRIVNVNNVDYAIVKNQARSSLNLVSGYQPSELYRSTYVQNAKRDRFAFDATYLNSTETVGDKLLIPADGGVYTFGNHSPGFPKSMVKEYSWN